ncbi:MAG: DNA-processing protein DprA [Patescibacteria group bacterium]|nr:DNA-processing protein DprA [Patescibacteria group bacterium]
MKSAIKIIKLKDQDYPALLREIPNPPSILYYSGSLPSKNEKLIAIVGTRKATSEGKTLAKQIGKELTKQNISIVSGLALGIDAAAHEGTLFSNGKTYAILANGLDTIYPRQHEQLAKKIIETGGGIFSEYQPGTPAYPNQFLERNRIISGLCIATIIIEAPIHSGTLATAKYAGEQGREVFIFPGNVNHSNFKGSHMLIRSGARLVANIDDILEDLDLKPLDQTKQIMNIETELEKSNDPIKTAVMKTIYNNKKPISVHEIVEITNLEPEVVHQQLTFLTLDGTIDERQGKFILKKK